MSHSYSNSLPVNMSDHISQSSRLWNIFGQKCPGMRLFTLLKSF